MDRRPRAVQEQITVQPMGGETLLYDERRHMAFCLNRGASAVWRLADGTRGMAEIAAEAGAELGAAADEELVRLALDELRECGLMEAAAPDVVTGNDAHCGKIQAQAEATRELSRRAVLARLGLGAAALLPAIACIVAPTAAQAYSGCVDCSVARPRRGGTAPATPSGDPGQ